LTHPAMQKLGCEPVRQPRWPSWPETRSTSGAWSWMPGLGGYRRSATLWIRLRGMGSVLKVRVAVS